MNLAPDKVKGISLHVVREWRLWRPWSWYLNDWNNPQSEEIEGRAWTRRTATAHGRIARALRIAGNEERDIIDRATREAL